MYETRRRRKEGRKGGGGGGGSECRIISGLHTFRVSVHYVRSGAHQRRARSKKGRAGEERKGGGYLSEIVISCYYRTRQISRRNTRESLPIKLSSSHEKPSFFPSPLQRNELKAIERIARPVLPAYRTFQSTQNTATSSIAPPIHQYFLSNFLSSLFSPKGKKKKRNRFSETRLEISIDRKIYRWIYWAYGRLGLTKEIRMEGWHRYTLTRLSDARLLRRDAPQPRLSEAWNDIGLLPHRNLLSGDRLVIVTNRPLYS